MGNKASFFHGGHSAVAQWENCDSHHSLYSQFGFGESLLGELEFIPSTASSTASSTSQLLAAFPYSRFEAMAKNMENNQY